MIHDSYSEGGSVRVNAGSDFMNGLNDAVRQNPIPAALVGVGILWLFTGGRNVMLGGASRSVAGGIGRQVQGAGEAAYRGAQAATGRVADGAHAVVESAMEIGSQRAGAIRNAADAMSSTVNRAGEIASGAAFQAASRSSQHGNEMGRQSQSYEPFSGAGGSMRNAYDALASLVARQPLMLGAVGVAIGAAVAASLPVSQNENQLMGGSADVVKDQAGKLWSEAKRRGADLASRSMEEAEVQGLTPHAAAGAARTVATKVAGLAEKVGKDIVDRTI